jgi:hypothetical protein
MSDLGLSTDLPLSKSDFRSTVADIRDLAGHVDFVPRADVVFRLEKH